MADTSHSLLFLSQREVIEAGVLNMEQVVPLMEKVYGLHWRGETVLPSKGVIRWGGVETEWEKGRINALPGWIGGDIRTGGIKWIAVSPEGVRAPGMPKVAALVIINDPVTLYPVAIMDGVLLSAIRTGANMGAAALHLAKEDTRTIAIVGGGFQGRTQLMALLVARPQTREIRIYDVNRAQAENFARHMEKRTGRKVAVCATVDETVKGADIVALRKEMTIVNYYLDIIRIRFPNRFNYVFDVDPALEDLAIPRFIIQPVVENAIYHGLESRLEKGTLTISCHTTETGGCALCVTDDGVGIPPERLAEIHRKLSDKSMQNVLNVPAGNSLALVNIHNRLRNLYGANYGLDIVCPPEGGTRVTLHLPMVLAQTETEQGGHIS